MMPELLDRQTYKKMRHVLADILGDWALARLEGNRSEEKEMEKLAHKVWHHIDGSGPWETCLGLPVAKRGFKQRGHAPAARSKRR
jgi:hypothetical protein